MDRKGRHTKACVLKTSRHPATVPAGTKQSRDTASGIFIDLMNICSNSWFFDYTPPFFILYWPGTCRKLLDIPIYKMKFSKTFTNFFVSLFLFASLLPVRQVSAAEGGGKDGESAYIRLEPFTVNLADLSQYLQIGLTLQGGSPEAGAAVATLMPKVRHEMILLLSSKEATELLSPAGKVKLREEIKLAINNVIELSGKHGVTGVLFASFIIQ